MSLLLGDLDSELAWRLKEISGMKRSVRSSPEPARIYLTRAGVALLYAHWEGFTKKAAILYGHFISNQKLRYEELKLSFSGAQAIQYVATLSELRKRIFVATDVLSDLHAVEEKKANLRLDRQIGEVGNMSFELFSQIVEFLALDPSTYTTRKALIDELLLRRRNEIAHGEYLEVGSDDFESLIDEVIPVMRQFKNDIQNSAVSESYLRAA